MSENTALIAVFVGLSIAVFVFMVRKTKNQPVYVTLPQLVDSTKPGVAATTTERYMPSVLGAVRGDIAVFDSFGNVTDSSYFISDNIASPNAIWSGQQVQNTVSDALKNQLNDSTVEKNSTWSSSAILSNLTAVADALKPDGGAPGNFVTYSSSGNMQDSGLYIDNTTTGSKILWSSDGVVKNVINDSSTGDSSTYSSKKMEAVFLKKDPSPSSGIVFGSQDGNVVSSDFTIDDALGPAANVLWSSEKVQPKILGKSRHLLSMDDAGQQAVASTFTVNDLAPPSESVLWSSNKIPQIEDSGVTSVATWSSKQIVDTIQAAANVLNQNSQVDGISGNLASITENGTLKDSGVSSLSLQVRDISAKNKNLASFESGSTVDSGFTVDDSTNMTSNVLWSSNGIVSNVLKDLVTDKFSTWSSEKISKMVNVSEYSGQLLTGNQDGKIVGSGFTVSDTDAVSAAVLWSSDKTQNYINSRFPKSSAMVASSNGILFDSGFVVDDNLQSSKALWSSSKMNSTFLPRVSGPVGNVLTSGSNGVAQTSSFSIDDASNENANVLWSSNKIANSFLSRVGTPNSIIYFDSNGNVASTISINDDSVGKQVLWSSSQIESKLNLMKQSKICFDAASDQSFSLLNTPIPYTITTLNVGNGLNAQTGIFSAPQIGNYFLHWQGVQDDTQGLNVRIFMKKNGDKVVGTYSYQTRHNQLSMSCIQNLQIGDRIWVDMEEGSIMSKNTDLFTKFSGFLMG
jgi:hypothetical protein